MKVLITGGSSEIAQAIAKRRSDAGDEILFTSSSESHLARAQERFTEMGVPARGYLFDFDDPESADPALFEQPVDAIVLNAFSKNPKLRRFHELGPEVIRKYFEGNITGNAELLWRFIPGMMERKFGRIVYISSLSAVMGTSRYSVYCAAKSALEGLVLNLAVDYAEFNLLSNIVRPGIIATERTRRLWEKSYYAEKAAKIIPQRKLGTADQVAESIDPLLSTTSYINGSVLAVTGGFPMMRSEGALDL